MFTVSKNFKSAATVCSVAAGSLLFTAGMGIAGAEPVPAPTVPDDLVTVTQGEATIVDSVATAEAASAITQLCGPAAPNALGLAQQVDLQGASQVACAGLPAGDVVVTQNVSVTSPVVPGTSAETSVDPAAEPAAPVPPGAETSAGDTDGAGAAEPLPPEEEETGSPAADESIGATWDPI
jgi:hypothetical protein